MLLLFYILYPSGVVPFKNQWLFVLRLFSFIIREYNFVSQIKLQFSLHRWQNFSFSILAILMNKRKLAAVSRETPGSTRNSRAQNAIDQKMAQEYVSHVSEETDGRVTKKLSKEFSRTESRILGALWKLDEFLLNPQVRTCSVAVPGTSKISNSGNREPFGDRSLDDPCPEVRFPSRHSGNLNSPEVEEYPHMVTGGPEKIGNRPHMTTGIQGEIPYCSRGTSSGKQRRRAPQVSHKFAVRTLLRQLRQIRFC